MDKFDKTILAQLQRDASQTNAELAEIVALSVSQISRRRSRLEQSGAIISYRAELDADKLGFGIDAFIRVTLTAHSGDTADEFSQFLASLPQICNAFALTGAADYLVHARLRNLDELSTLVNRSLLPHPNVHRVQSEIALQKIVRNAPLDLQTG